MIVVADTTPLRYLVFIGEEHVLPKLYGTVYVPPEVLAELGRSKAPRLEPVRSWASSPPEWIHVKEPKVIEERLLQSLDRGEAEAIALAEELKADRILIDEDRGRKMVVNLAEEKKERGEEALLQVDATLALLTVAAVRDYIDIEKVVGKLRLTNFRATEKLYQQTIENVRVRKLAQEQERALREQVAPEQSPPQPDPSLKQGQKRTRKRDRGFGMGM